MTQQQGKQDYFVAFTECHMFDPEDLYHIAYFPDFQRWWKSVEGVVRVWSGRSLLQGGFPTPKASELIKYMDEAGVDVAFCLREVMLDISGYTQPMSTNAFIIREIEPYKGRMYLECNVGPILHRGVKHAIWELEYLVKNHDAKLCKVYACEDGPLNDKRLWPFYEAAAGLGVPLTIHTGAAYVWPQPNKYTHPGLLDDIMLDFPDLTIIAYHLGWPYYEELFALAAKHENLIISLSGIAGWLARAPWKGYHLVGEALMWAGPDKIVLGLDLPFDDLKRIVDYFRNFQIPEELREKYAYPEITDEIRAKILGLNLARITKIEPVKRVPNKQA